MSRAWQVEETRGREAGFGALDAGGRVCPGPSHDPRQAHHAAGAAQTAPPQRRAERSWQRPQPRRPPPGSVRETRAPGRGRPAREAGGSGAGDPGLSGRGRNTLNSEGRAAAAAVPEDLGSPWAAVPGSSPPRKTGLAADGACGAGGQAPRGAPEPMAHGPPSRAGRGQGVRGVHAHQRGVATSGGGLQGSGEQEGEGGEGHVGLGAGGTGRGRREDEVQDQSCRAAGGARRGRVGETESGEEAKQIRPRSLQL